ncbi:fibronectin type III domain-containing protein [Mycetocola manganoxydans]|uniref:Fibronectin type III domain-containing protein n=1 Tax=Mycetocola manganoxydans TaxID=699879 RepID=A0A3L7A2U7_9MICO|nr:Ig-like domain-containing protein [Mycetocola manganoxydans]RLP73921.1 fibronectin type III domain-containing protein [Mycetocola manganoxydans]GHD42307.1 fibronectin type III [Mycetocola manganoxydans]
MFRQWLRSRRSLIATLTSGTAICALIAGVAVVSTGYRAQQLDLGDGAVWVVNNAREAVGRANTQVFELNAGIPAGSDQLDVVQEGETVLVVDRAQSTLSIVDPATADVVESVPLPSGLSDVQLAGDRVTVNADGDIWLVPVDELETFDAESEPALSFGPGSIVSAAPSGDVFAFSPEAGEIYRVAHGQDTVSSTTQVSVDADARGFQLTSVGTDPVLLDGVSNRLIVNGVGVDLGDAEDALLPQPSASGAAVLVGANGRLLSVPLSGGEPTDFAIEAQGVPARPVTVGDCDYAAWADGAVFTRCGAELEQTSLGRDGSALEFRVNDSHVVLNDSATGMSWAVQAANEEIDNWEELLNVDEDEQQVDDNQEDTPPEFEETQLPPTAVDDAFGVRPGKTSPLPVLLNDVDPNGDVLMVDSFTAIDERFGRLDLVNNAQQLQVTLSPDATGEARFDYTITDGRKGTSTATVTLTVRAENENGPPEQVRKSKASVAAGGRLTTDTLGDWVDPDGDPFYLKSASIPAPDQVQYTPDGTLVYTDAGLGGSMKEIALAVSDGSADGAGSFAVTVYAPGEVPIITEPFPVVTYAGQEVLVSPLPHVRGGSGPLRLANVPAKAGATITPDYDGGTFRFQSSEAGTHNVEYSVTDGNRTATGTVRIEVKAQPEPGAPPVTVPHTAYIREQSTERVDVLAGDFDPAGGVLVVTGVLNVPEDSGLQVEILEQRILRVTLTVPLDAPVSFNYLVSNGTSEARGTVTVVEIPTPEVRQPPVAYPDTISVRVGDAIDIPVLRNDTHPDGDTLTLSPALSVKLPADSGLLFASGRVLRYLAPDKPGNFTASYRAVAPDGQWADAQVTLNVREVDAASNSAPVPGNVTARVLSGERVRISIPLAGIDPDGDSVQLVGQASNPGKGAVVDSGEDWFDYQAGAYSTGTDTFDYTVIDALGSQATGTVRVGISAKLDGSRMPIAMPDEVISRPDRTIAVQVLLNDSDPDGGELSVTSVDPMSEGATAEVDGDLVRVSVPEGEGRFGFVYEIENKWGNTSTSFLTVITRDDAPLARPVPGDIVLTLDDILERSSVDVNVLSRVFFAEGSVSRLDVSLPRENSGAEVLDSKRVRVPVAARSQIIPFQVSRPDDASISAIAFIWVPGLDDALPQLRPGTKPISVVSGEAVTIDINDYVLAVGRKSVRLTDAAKVRASHANGADLVVDDDTIRYTSAERYFGPASISFEVTDGSSATDPAGRIATIVLPLDVTPRENQPPVFAGGVLEFQPGEKKTIELSRLTTYPYADDLDELSYSILDPRPEGFSASISGQKLELTADPSIAVGAKTGILIGVRDAVNEGEAGRLVLDVTPSTRPIAVPAADSAVVQRGTTEVIDVLENDAATNPFPSTPLRVVAVQGLGGALPAGVVVSPSADNSRLSVSVAADAAPTDATLQYQVADATDDPSRFAWGTVRISVQDRPEPVTNVRMTGFGHRTVTLAWEPGASNNSPLTGFNVELFRAGSGESLGTTVCSATTCEVGTPGNGRDNAVRAQVSAVNAVGASDPQRLVDPVWSDVVPAAPGGLTAAPLDGGLRIGWDTVTPQRGSSVKSYVVTVGGGAPVTVLAGNCSASRCSTEVTGLANGNPVPFTVSARNDSYPALSTWNSSSGSGTPYGQPRAGGISVNADSTGGTATVSWEPFSGNGDAIGGYYVQMLAPDATPTPCTVSSPAPGSPSPPGGGIGGPRELGAATTSTTFTDLTAADGSYRFVVWGFNKAGCVATETVSATLRPTPPPVTDIVGAMQWTDSTETVRDYFVSAVNPGGYSYEIRSPGGEWQPFSGSGYPRQILGAPFGQPVSFEVRAVSQYGDLRLSGSALDRTAPAPSITLIPEGRSYSGDTATWTWTGNPPNGAYAASYSCGAVNDATIEGTAGTNSCILSAPPADGQAWLNVTVTVNGETFTTRYFTP